MKNFLKEFFIDSFLLIILFRSLRRQLHELGAPFITEAGQAVLDDPEKMKKVKKAIEEYNAAGKHGPVIVEFD